MHSWLMWGAALCAVARAGQPPPTPPPQPAAATAPDDGLIEFLGADDVPDSAWSEYLKRAASRKVTPPAPPPQDAKQ